MRFPIYNYIYFYIYGIVIIFSFFPDGMVFASNQTEAVGVGTRAIGRGGVEVAIADDCAAMVSNPAGITQIEKRRFDLGMSFEVPFFRYRNDYTNTNTIDKHTHTYSVPGVGFVKSWNKVSMGLGLYGIGGAGAELYFNSPFFDEEKEGRAKLGLAKLTPTVGYKFNSKLSLGVALNIHYGTLDLHAPLGPAYIEFDNLEGLGGGMALGMLYKFNEKVSFGICYTTQSFNQDFEAERAFLETSPQIGGFKSRYDAKMIDFQVPQRISVGVAFRPFKRMLIGFDIDWTDYSENFDKFKFKLYDGEGPDQFMSLDLDYMDLYIIAIGLEYNIFKGFIIRCGYDYCSDITPGDSDIPVLGIYSDVHHLTLGLGYEWEHLEMNLAYCRSLIYREHTKKEKLNAPELINGYHDHRDYYFSIMISLKY